MKKGKRIAAAINNVYVTNFSFLIHLTYYICFPNETAHA